MFKSCKTIVLSAAFVALFLMPDGCRVLAGPKEKLISLLTKDIAAGIGTDFERCFNHSHKSPIVFLEKLKEFCKRAIDSIFRKLQSDAFWDQIRGDYLFWNFLQDCENYREFEKLAIERYSFDSTKLGVFYDKLRSSFEMGYNKVKKEKPRYQMRSYNPLVRKDADVLAKFLWQRLFPTFKESSSHLRTSLAMRQGRLSLLKEAVAGAFKGKKIRTGSLFSVLEFKEEELNKKFKEDLLKLLKKILEEGDLFSGKFVDMFWMALGEDIKALPCCQKVDSLCDFFDGYIPFSDTEMAYGVKVFKLSQAQEIFEKWEADYLFKLKEYIDDILRKRNIILHTALLQTPEGEVREFFGRMTERLQSVNEKVQKRIWEEQKFWDPWYWKIEPNLGDDEAKKIFDELEEKEGKELQSVNEKVQKRILEEQKFWDPWYWKSEPYFNNEEKKKIFDELNESEEQVKDDGCELKKRTSRVTSKPISTQRAISQGMPMMPAPGWKTTWGINEAGVPEVSLKYEF